MTIIQKQSLFATALAVFAVFLDTTILFVAFNAIGQSFPDVSPAQLSWVLNAYTIVFAAVLIPGGRLADRIGRKKTFLGSVVLFTLASMLCGLAPNVQMLIAARALQAVGAAAMVPSSLALVLQIFPREKVPVAVAIWSAVGAVAGAVGPTAGALIIQHFGWPWAFYLNLPVGIVSFTLGSLVLTEGKEQNPRRFPDPLSIVLLMASLSSLAYAVLEFQLTPLVSGLLLLAGFVARCRQVSNPLLDLTLFDARSFRLANIALFIFATGFSAMFLGNVLFLTHIWGYSLFRTGLVVALGPLVVALTAPHFGRLAARIGQRALLIPGGLVWGSGAFFLTLNATTRPHYVTQYLPAILLTSLGVSLVLPQLSSVAVQDLPSDQFGSGSAASHSIRNLGTTIGVALVVSLTARMTLESFHHVWALLMLSGLSVSLLSSRLSRR